MNISKSESSINAGYAIIMGIIYFIVAKGFGSGIEFARTLAISLLDLLGGFVGVLDFHTIENEALNTNPYFWPTLFMISSIFSIGVSYYLSDEGIANKILSAIGSTFAQLVIGNIITEQRVTLPVQMFLLFVAFGALYLYCKKYNFNFFLLILAPLVIPSIELLLLLPFVLLASKLSSLLAILVTVLCLIFVVFICYPVINDLYYNKLLQLNSQISSFCITWVVCVLLFCLFFGNQPNNSNEGNTETNEIQDVTEYHNSFVERISNRLNELLEESANWLSEGEYDRIKNGETNDTNDYVESEPLNEESSNDVENEIDTQNDNLDNAPSLEEAGEGELLFQNSEIEIFFLGLKSENERAFPTLTIEIINKTNIDKEYIIRDGVITINDRITMPAYFYGYDIDGNKITTDIIIDSEYNHGVQIVEDFKFGIQSYYPILEDGVETGTYEIKNETDVIDVSTSLYG